MPSQPLISFEPHFALGSDPHQFSEQVHEQQAYYPSFDPYPLPLNYAKQTNELMPPNLLLDETLPIGVQPHIEKTGANINLSQFLVEEKDYFGFDHKQGLRQSAIQQNMDDLHSLQLNNEVAPDDEEGNQTSINLSEYLEQAYEQQQEQPLTGYQVKYAEEDEIKLSMDSSSNKKSDKRHYY